MAYMRGDNYIWEDVSGFHFWAKDGYDGWDDAIWAADEENGKRRVGFENASGMSLHTDVTDAFVMMRVAHLIHEGKVDQIIDRATDPNDLGGNFGSLLLARNAAKLKEAFSQIKLDDVE